MPYFVAIANHGGAGQGKHEAVSQFGLLPVAQHGEQAAGGYPGRKAACVFQGRNGQILFAAVHPSAGPGPARRGCGETEPTGKLEVHSGFLQSFFKRFGIGSGQGVKQVLVYIKVKHHVDAVALVAKVFLGFFG